MWAAHPGQEAGRFDAIEHGPPQEGVTGRPMGSA